MIGLGPLGVLGFTTPFVLLGLLALPVIYYLVRALLPSPNAITSLPLFYWVIWRTAPRPPPAPRPGF